MPENPNYYAIIPADVRYDKRLKPNAKLLYGEITCLTNAKGFCWATNKYFSDLYNVSTNTISEWVNQLKRYEYINVTFTYKENSKEIENRIIKIKDSTYHEKEVGGYPEKTGGGIPKKREDNNTSINNTRKNNIIPTLLEVEDYITLKKYDVTAITFINYYEALNWHDKNGKVVKNWKLKLLSWHNHALTNNPSNNNKKFKDYE